ncbi:MAG TPA: hypothetical protein VGY55_12645 [Pirellulales bacterium]|jgi:hypothetical protein|nr:hypothetical protein [Pirellulales bacterium]
MPDKNRAKQIIVEIVRLSGGKFDSTTRLFKAFYFAHLYYARIAPGYLSDWPIVRMPRGPGIDDGRALLEELAEEGLLEIRAIPTGPYTQMQYRTASRSNSLGPLPLNAIDAIRDAVNFVNSRTAAELSDLTHECSRSWRSAKDGDELNIYADLSTDEDFANRQEAFKRLDPILEEIWCKPV